jgi:hypothetical protein
MNIPEKITQAMAAHKNKTLSKAEIIEIVRASYPGINISSIRPNYYCSNNTTKNYKAINYYIFQYIGLNKYKVL